MTKKITPIFILVIAVAMILNWLKIDKSGIGLFTLFMVLGSIQFYSAIIIQYDPLVRFLLILISVGSIILALQGILGGYKVFGFFAIEPLIYVYFTKDPHLMVKWKPNNT